MKKRSIAFLLVLAMLAAVLPAGVTATESSEAAHAHTDQHTCQKTSAAWVAWGDDEAEKTTLPKTAVDGSTHFYLTSDISVSSLTEVSKDVTIHLCLNGYSIDGQQKTGIYKTVAGAELIIEDCGAVFDEDGKFVSGGRLTGGKNTNAAGAIYALGGKVTLRGILLTGNQGNSTTTGGWVGGAITCRSGSEILVENCKISDNITDVEGGAMAVRGTATVKNTVISDNCAASGGAVYVSGGTLMLENVTATGNHNTDTGASFLQTANSAKVTLTDTVATGNYATGTSATWRGGIYVGSRYDSLTLSGKTVVDNNTLKNGTVEVNVLLPFVNTVVKVNGLTDGAKLSINTRDRNETTPGVFLTAEATPEKWNLSWVTYENNGMAVDYDKAAGQFVFTENTTHRHCFCDHGNLEQCSHDSIAWLPWKKTDSLPTSGNYYLENDVELSAPVELTDGAELNLCLNGRTVTAEGAEGTNSDRIFYLWGKAALSISDCAGTGKLTGGTAAAICLEGNAEATLNLYGGSITGNTRTGSLGGAVVINATNKQSTFNMYGGEISGNSAGTHGGAIHVRKNGIVNIYGGMIANNVASTYEGGAIRVIEGGTLNIYGGTLSGNSAQTTGGAIYVSGGTVELSGGEIADNTASNGGGIYVGSDGVLNLAGGTVSGNTAALYGGGICVAKDAAQVQLSGDPAVTGNTVNGQANNLHLRGTATVIVDIMESKEHQVGVTAEELPRFVSQDMTADQSAYFFSDSVYRSITCKENKLYMGNAAGHEHCACAGAEEGCEHVSETWGAWESTTSLPSTSGYYYLLSDVTLSQAVTLTGGADVKLCLNGHTVTVNGEGTDDRIFYLWGQAALTLSDCTAHMEEGKYVAGKLTGGTNSGICLESNANATVNLYDGIITGNTRTGTLGGAVVLNTTAKQNTFNMYGGEISGNSADTHGGAIHLKKNCTVNLYGGTIANNTAKTYEGGAIRVIEGGVLNIYGGTISGNTAKTSGGAIAVDNSTLNITGGTISGNTAASGGGMYLRGVAATVSGVSITGNTATGDGGGITLSAESQVILEEVSVQKNTAKNGAGSILLSGSQLTMASGSIHKNAALENGGGIYVSKTATLTLTGGEISENEAYGGAGVYHYQSVGTYTGGTISGNVAKQNGGGIYANGSTVSMNGVKITSNAAKQNGGGVFANAQTALIVTEATVSQNTAGEGGGGLLLQLSDLSLNGGTIENNKAAKQGGGLRLLGATATMQKAVIRNNTANEGGGVSMSANKAKSGETTVSAMTMESGSVIGNAVTGSGGGIVLAGGSKLDVCGGSISSNTAINGAGILAMSKATVNLKGGTVSKNAAKDNGGAVYISRTAIMNMTGGEVCTNTAGRGGAGIYHLESTGIYSGGAVCHNLAEGNGAGLYSNKGTLTLKGSFRLAENTAKEAGGALVASNSSAVNINGGTIIGNAAPRGGAIVTMSKTVLNVNGGTITRNTAAIEGGAMYISTNCTFNMTGGEVCENTAVNRGGAILMNSPGTISGGVIRGNKAIGSEEYKTPVGGGVIIIGQTDTIKTLTISGGEIIDNYSAGHAGGVRVNYGNSLVMTGGTVANNTAEKNGGGIEFYGHSTVTGSTITGNTAGGDGGGMRANMQVDLVLENLDVSNNTSGGNGGAIYLNRGATAKMTECALTGNAAQQGGALWAVDDLSMHSCTITGNACKDGAAVYLAPGEFDGHSYFVGLMKMSGNMRICDNAGEFPGLYISDGTVMSVGAQGLGEDTLVHVYLEKGVLTKTLFGNYDYEGGNGVYTVTYGNRSATDFEVEEMAEEPAEPSETITEATESTMPAEQPQRSNGVIYVAIGAMMAALAAAVAIVLAVKKKSSKQDKK